MNNKKIITLLIMFTIIFTLLGGTFAYWNWQSEVSKNVVFKTAKGMENYIVYDEGTSHFVGNFQPSSDHCGGISSTISFLKTAEASNINLVATINMDVNSIGENIRNSDYVKWAITTGNSDSCSSTVLNSGTFKNVEDNTKITLQTDISLDIFTDETGNAISKSTADTMLNPNNDLYSTNLAYFRENANNKGNMFTIWIWIDESGDNLSSLSGETIDANIWTFIDIIPEEYKVTLDANGGSIIETTLYTTVGENEYIVPETGNYILEVWGGQGGIAGSYEGGYGGYSVGTISLRAGTTLYANVGGQGESGYPDAIRNGGYNGGGSVPQNGSYTNRYVGAGGGATHIATVSGELSNLSENIDDILIVAGGGGGGYQHLTAGSSYAGYGGAGGGILGNDGTGHAKRGLGGSQIAAGTAYGGSSYGVGGFGYGGDVESGAHGGAGGGGFYGGGACRGGANDDGNSGGGGGSGYIGNSLLTNKAMYCYNCSSSSETSTLTYSTSNVSSIPVSNCAKSGDGAIKITLLTNTKTVINGLTYGTLPMPTREGGYRFKGWNTKADGTGTTITSSTIVDLSADTKLYAIWELESVIINYYDNLNRIDKKDSLIVTLNTRNYYKAYDGVALAGYMYNGEYTMPILISTETSSLAVYDSYDSSTIHKYEDNSDKNGTFIHNGITYYYMASPHGRSGTQNDTSGSGTIKLTSKDYFEAAKELVSSMNFTSESYAIGTNQTLMANPYTRENYIFVGWSLSPTGDLKYTDGQIITELPSTSTINLYAVWEQNT